jgi:hypothetical protein
MDYDRLRYILDNKAEGIKKFADSNQGKSDDMLYTHDNAPTTKDTT